MVAAAVRDRLIPLAARGTPRPAEGCRERLFIVQPDHLGDILLSEPAVRYLRQALPSTELVAVVGPWSEEITRMAWPVDRIVTVEFPGFTRQERRRGPRSPYQLLALESARLRQLQAADAIVLRDDAWWAAWLARSAVAGDVVTGMDPRAMAFSTAAAPTANAIHRTAIALRIAETYLDMRGIEQSSAEWDMSPRLRDAERAPGHLDFSRTTIAIHPGSGSAVKGWPPARWRTLIAALADHSVTLTGSSSERQLCDTIAAGFGHATVVAGETSLPELAAVFQSSRLAIGTDNGPMHLAGAVGTPTIRLFGPSNPQRYGPWPGTSGQLVISAGWCCPHCEDLSANRPAGCGCMLAINPDVVIDAVNNVLADGA